ncbi:MAG: ribosome maturation factor RimM [Acidobacteriota bacterium]
MRDLPEWIEVGRILRPHGIRGDLKIQVESDVVDRFAVGRTVIAELGRGGRGGRRTLEIKSARHHSDGLLARVAGVDDRDAAEALRNATLVVRRDDVPPPPDDQWYVWQLAGCRCSDVETGDLGTVETVIEDGGGHLLSIVDDQGRRLLVPFVNAMCTAVDVEAGRIELDLPPGLIEACRA